MPFKINGTNLQGYSKHILCHEDQTLDVKGKKNQLRKMVHVLNYPYLAFDNIFSFPGAFGIHSFAF
jgi:hypothetical protein